MIRFLLNSLTKERSPEQVQANTQVENWDRVRVKSKPASHRLLGNVKTQAWRVPSPALHNK